MAVWWQNTSSPPPSCVMNPKPFVSLNHFTVPVAIFLLLLHARSHLHSEAGNDDVSLRFGIGRSAPCPPHSPAIATETSRCRHPVALAQPGKRLPSVGP